MAFPHHPHRVPEDGPEPPRQDRTVLGALGALLGDLAALGPGHGRADDPDADEGPDAAGALERRSPRPGGLTATA
ncbi:hypothetical protein [Kitasatospora sp. DSM 101779]|uniref:hypothetical protein n=1 Tax=Kitasatospora sp. DSM 101779 TaxID=2853165 RepID=UPI0021DA31E0|nr:hypothetical protein [Kitasatospora sp. DSM 101779]MCU7826588.1 hypothetical protein [Kitasatospora sp. DSM 101779]